VNWTQTRKRRRWSTRVNETETTASVAGTTGRQPKTSEEKEEEKKRRRRRRKEREKERERERERDKPAKIEL
jgi:hypothetical protein